MQAVPSSFRDPSGFVYREKGVLYRCVNQAYRQQYRKLMDSGLYGELVRREWLVPHEEMEVSEEREASTGRYCTLKPMEIPFISYPYEWCFEQYKTAALTVLQIHRTALGYGMVLKDASAYNIQFLGYKPMLIDTLSFEEYHEGMLWLAYGQFCRHFLAPLMLMAHTDIRLSQLMRVYIDGIPIDLASKLLGRKGGWAGTQHIHWHAKATERHSQEWSKNGNGKRQLSISRFQHTAMVESMIRTVERLALPNIQTEWGEYYDNTNYSHQAADQKAEWVKKFVEEVSPQTAWDCGANNGFYSRIACDVGAYTVAFDIDAIAINKNYHFIREARLERMLPLVLDLTNPSAAIGFANAERTTVAERQHPDLLVVLALIHHLSISNNLPFEKIADWFAQLSPNLIIEFVPKEDSQVQKLLATRDDIFTHYTQEDFEKEFSRHFTLKRSVPLEDSLRTLYLFAKKSGH